MSIVLYEYVLTLQVPMVWIDTKYYGGIVIAPLNIILYNVFTEHGPSLYGKFHVVYSN